MPRCGRPASRAVSRPVCTDEKNPALSVDRKLFGTSTIGSHPAKSAPAVAPHDPPRSADACRSAIGRPILRRRSNRSSRSERSSSRGGESGLLHASALSTAMSSNRRPTSSPHAISTASDRCRQPGHDKAAGPPDSERIRADTRPTPLRMGKPDILETAFWDRATGPHRSQAALRRGDG